MGGETFNEDQSHFLERVTVLSEAATLDKLGISVTNYVNQFKQDADQMAEALKDAMATIDSIQTNIISGNFLLTGQKTLKDTWDYVQSVQMAGETMSQTYQRLEQAAQTYNQIMDTVNQGIFQMTQGGDPAAVFAATVANIDTNAEKMIAQLNAAAQAAGLSGAAEADLAKVHKYAALQAQQAIASTEAKLEGLDRRRNDLASREERLTTELEQRQGNLLELRARTEQLALAIEDLKSGKVTSAEEKDELETRLTDLRARIGESEQLLEEAKTDASKKRSRFHALSEMFARREGLGAGAKALVETNDQTLAGLLADRVEAPADLTGALACV